MSKSKEDTNMKEKEQDSQNKWKEKKAVRKGCEPVHSFSKYFLSAMMS